MYNFGRKIICICT